MPQKKAQIVVAKPEPVKKKRGRKPLPLELKALRPGKPPRKLIKPSIKDSLNTIKKPLQPASFTYTSMGRSSSSRDSLGLHSRGAFSQSGGAVKPPMGSMGPGRSLGSALPSFSSRPPQAKGGPDFKPSMAESSRGTGLDLKSTSSSSSSSPSSKSPGVASMNVHKSKLSTNTSSNSSNQGTHQSSLGSLNGPKKHNVPAGQTPIQRLPNNKAAAPFLSAKGPVGQAMNMQALKLQSSNKPAPCSGGPAENVNMAAANFRGAANPTRKSLGGNQRQESSLQPASVPNSGPTQQPKKNQPGGGGEKVRAEDSNDSGNIQDRSAKRPPHRVEKTPSLKPLPTEIREPVGKRERSSSKDGGKAKVLSEMSTGEEGSTSDSDQEDSPFPSNGQDFAVQPSQDWKPTRSLIEHVFVTDVTANLVTVTVKESPTSVGFFSLRNY